MPEPTLKSSAVRGVAWSLAGSYANKFVQFLVSIVLARLLTPADYGLIGMLGFFMGIASSLIDCGFSNALIRFDDRSERDFCTVFYVNFGLSVLMYAILALAAPWIADFYSQPVLVPIIRIYCLTLIIGAFSAVNSVQLTIGLRFKESTLVSTTAAIISGCCGLAFAFTGFGVWALVFQQIIAAVMRVILLFVCVRWHPKLIFSVHSFRRLFGYGSKLLVSSLIHNIYIQLYPLIIGKQFQATDLGYVTRGQQFNEFAAGTINGVLSQVAFPVLSRVQHDDSMLLDLYSKYIRLSAFVICPVILFMCGVARPMVIFLLTDKWAPCVIFLQILSVSYIWDGVTKINLNLLYVKGRSDLFLRLEIIKKTIAFAILIASTLIGNLIVFCAGMTLYSCIALYINTYYTKKILHFGFLQQMRQLAPYLLYSVIIMVIALLFSRIIKTPVISLLVSTGVCVPLYLLLCRVTRLYALREAVRIAAPRLGAFGRLLRRLAD